MGKMFQWYVVGQDCALVLDLESGVKHVVLNGPAEVIDLYVAFAHVDVEPQPVANIFIFGQKQLFELG